jgi:hypothetical protein
VVIFDKRLSTQDAVEIVSDYSKLTAINGGWADQKYDADVTIRINNSDIGTSKPKTDAKTISTAIGQIVTPFFNARTANFTAANANLFEIVRLTDVILTLNDQQTATNLTVDVPPETVSALFKELDDLRSNLHVEVAAQIKTSPITGEISTSRGSATFDVVTGDVELANAVDKYSDVRITVEGVTLTNSGELSHAELEDAFESVNSGLTASFASVRYANMIKMGIQDQIADPFGRADANQIYQAAFYAGCDDWYDRFNSTVDYTEEVSQEPVRHITSRFDTFGFSINYPSDVLYIPSINEVWISGSGGIISIHTTTLNVKAIFKSQFYVFNLHLDQGTVFALAEDGLYRITTDGVVTKDVNIDLPDGVNSAIVFGNTTYVSTKTALLFKRDYEIDWREVFKLNDGFVRSTDRLTFAVGVNPDAAGKASGKTHTHHAGV